ncbi:MAG: TetR/AcrR family transcriptional regulator [Hyphomicrobiaceae bacterium]|jgi:AcrR family transcriptional regulator|nr:MAG: TetR/AcrR family transcriptional regulator [Hyphomicrobiaceae bacterium]
MKTRPKSLPADQRRAATVEAVIELAAERNPGDITTAAIAGRMNLTQGALFRHFASKEAVWEAVMEWVAERLTARVDQATRDAASPLAALEAAFLAHVEFVVVYPGVPRMLFGELQRAEDTAAKRRVRRLLAQYGERLAGLIEAGKAAGELTAEIGTDAAVAHFIGTVQGLVMQSLLAGDPERVRYAAPTAFAIFRRAMVSAR